MRGALLPTALACVLLSACGGGDDEPAPPTRAVTPEEVARAEAFLAENRTPLPEGWRFADIAFGEGSLRVGLAAREAPKGTIVFVPGYTSSPELASDFLARWHEDGWEVASLDLPGQGGSMRREDDYQKPYTGDFAFYGEAVSAAAQYIDSRRQSSGPLVMAGDSFGGHSVLRAAADGGLDEADGLFVLVPAVMPELEAPRFLVKWVVGRAINRGDGGAYMDGLGQWQPDNFDAYDWKNCGDREDRNFMNTALQITKPEMRVGGATNEWGLGMVTSGETLLKSDVLRAFDRPVGMVIAGQDTIVSNDEAIRLCDRMEACDLHLIAEATHCVYLEDQATQDKVHGALEDLSARL